MKRNADRKRQPAGMGRLIAEVLRPYRGWLTIILFATAVETAASLAAPWPLKIILEHLPLAYYDTHQTGTLLSTIIDDIATIQDFASSATLGIVVDLLTIAGMLGLMFWLSWDFALIAVGVAPFLLLFVLRFRKAVKKASREVRLRESDLLSVVQQGLESIRVVNAFGRQELEEKHLADASQATVEAALKARRVKSLLSPVVTVTVSLCTAFVLWRGALLVLASAMTAGAL